jgi:hypothetical protein
MTFTIESEVASPQRAEDTPGLTDDSQYQARAAQNRPVPLIDWRR